MLNLVVDLCDTLDQKTLPFFSLSYTHIYKIHVNVTHSPQSCLNINFNRFPLKGFNYTFSPLLNETVSISHIS